MNKSPTFLYNTRHGIFFHLTPTNLQPLNIGTAVVSVGDFGHMEKILIKIKDANISFKQYCGLEEKNVYLTVADSYKEKCIEGVQQYDMVKVNQIDGMRQFTIDQYHKFADLIKPDFFVSLTETPQEGGTKSMKRSIDKSSGFLKKSLEHFKNKKIQIFAAIQGGISKELRSVAMHQIVDQIEKENFSGFVFYGLNKTQTWQQKTEAFLASYEEIPQELRDNNYQYILAGKGDIQSILWGVSLGFTSFEIEEPFAMAQNNKAILLDKLAIEPKDLDSFKNDTITMEEINQLETQFIQFPFPQQKLADHVALDSKCECFTCLNHTKLYISHLADCKEMNAQVLLTIHNVHQYQKLQTELQKYYKQKNQWIRWFLA